ncbi:MAG: hypothetical protein AAB432_00305 [Patescibacteria group bacterium]|mgnify:CR=1 FL=1
MKIPVIDVTGRGLPPTSVYLEGKLSGKELRLEDFLGVCRCEVKNSNGKLTTKITSDCIIFVVATGKPEGLYDDFFKGGIFKNII